MAVAVHTHAREYWTKVIDEFWEELMPGQKISFEHIDEFGEIERMVFRTTVDGVMFNNTFSISRRTPELISEAIKHCLRQLKDSIISYKLKNSQELGVLQNWLGQI